MNKKTNKKESIKATIGGLALALAIGGIGSLGSYAYFTDKAETKNDLIVTMGSLDVSLNNPINMSLDESKKTATEAFKIINSGSLKQHVSLKFSNFTNSELLSEIGCNLSMTYNGKVVKLKGYKSISKLSDLSNMNFTDLVYESGNLVELEPKGIIDCALKIDISNGNQENIQNQDIRFNTEVDSRQINSPGGNK
ncbi:TasA family protein [Clostridium sp. CCUG 7971]|uniref:TasA family protein n=1 Tax=Clostridium sp. CCUG 7971 TaxID=2811414 RepID=UPI001ABA088C|nr:TasA family protein [Clostridium sp. CCUG 7971]MBO3444223.1 hypothetical protein [Clostridium sp. CCUG 7971]